MLEEQSFTSTVEGAITEPGWADRVEAALRQEIAKPVNRWRNIRTLVVTMLLFIAVMGGQFTLVDGLIVVGVLLVHEAGHFLGMKLFDYRDVKMFFIPFMGAAVSGQARTPKGWQQVIVSLLGPTPGLLIGIVLGIVALKTDQPFLTRVARMTMFINAFNLLPFVPLDGGRVLETVIFSRHPAVEAGFKLFAAVCLGLIAYFLQSILLGVLALLQLITIPVVFSNGKAVRKLRETFVPDPSVFNDELPPRPYLQVIVDTLAEKLPKRGNPLTSLTSGVKSVWNRYRQRPPGLAASVMFMMVYVFSLGLAVIGPITIEFAHRFIKNNNVTITQRTHEDGRVVDVQVYHYDDASYCESEVNAEGWYHGKTINYNPLGKVESEGYWQDGFWHGEWRYYDENGALTSIKDYDQGRLVRYRIIYDAQECEIPPDDWESYTSTEPQLSPKGARRHLAIKRMLNKLHLSRT